MKTISIMITSYNLEEYIAEAIQSVTSQDMPCKWELLIGDDGSTDNTIKIVNTWIEKYPDNIKLYQWNKEDYHSMNGFRAAANRAKLLEKACGDYLIFLDGDDKWVGTKKLYTQFQILENIENEDCSCTAHNTYKYNIDEGAGDIMTKGLSSNTKLSLDEYWTSYYFHTNTLLFKKKCKELLLNALYRNYLNDMFITFCVLQYGKIYYIDEVWNQYNITGKGLFTGAPRMYSLFRGMHLYDLENDIAPNKHKLILKAQWFNILEIMLNYKKKDRKTIDTLVNNLDSSIFVYTSLLSKTSLTFKDVCRKFYIFTKCIYIGIGCKLSKLI